MSRAYQSVQQCMNDTDGNVKKVAQREKVPEYLTIDIKNNKLSVCTTLSSHQTPMLAKGGVNPQITKAYGSMKKDCDSLCK